MRIYLFNQLMAITFLFLFINQLKKKMFISKASEEANSLTQKHLRNQILIQINNKTSCNDDFIDLHTSIQICNFVTCFFLFCFEWISKKSPPTLPQILLMLKHIWFPPPPIFFITFYLFKEHFMCIISVSTTSEWVTCKQNSCTWEAFCFKPTLNYTDT